MCLEAMIVPNNYKVLGTDWNWDADTVTKANAFIYQLESATFLLCFNIHLECLTHLQGLTLKLQVQLGDVFLCLWSVNEVLSYLKTREFSETVFGTIFREMSKLFMVAVLNYILPE